MPGPGASTGRPSRRFSAPPATASRVAGEDPRVSLRGRSRCSGCSRGLSNREIAERLVITPKTVGNHIEHIYAKIDASTRATASLFAVHHGLLPEEEFAAGMAA